MTWAGVQGGSKRNVCVQIADSFYFQQQKLTQDCKATALQKNFLEIVTLIDFMCILPHFEKNKREKVCYVYFNTIKMQFKKLPIVLLAVLTAL